MADGMTDDDRRILERWDRAGFVTARAVLAEAARTDDLAERLDEALTLLADWLVDDGLDAAGYCTGSDETTAAALRGLVKNAGGGEAAAAPEEGPAGFADGSDDPVPAPSGSPAPERFVCADGVTREPTGEVRPPRKGEWFAFPGRTGSFEARLDFPPGEARRILRPVQDAAPDWESRARSAEAEVARLRDGIEREVAWARWLDYQGHPFLRALLDPPGADQ